MKNALEFAKPTLLIIVFLLSGFSSPPALFAQDLPGTPSPYLTLIDINFGAHQSPGLGANKVGWAATGLTASDFWNFYSRDDGHGHWLVNGALPNLRFADGSASSAGLIVSNAPGSWADGSSDAMYNTYVYPFNGGNALVLLTNLAAGRYDFYVYGPDGNYQLTVGPTNYGVKTTWDQPVINPPVWQEGRQYALYRGVSVGAGQEVILTVRPGAGGYAVISGMQMVNLASPCTPPPSGLVSWWRGERNALDQVGRNNGVLVNGVGFDAGIVGQAFRFNGSSNSFVEVADSPALRFSDAVTVECWAKRLNVSEVHVMVEKGGDWTGGQTDFEIALNDTYAGGKHFGFAFAGGWRGCAVTPDTAWHHYAAVAVSGQADPILYIDGVPQTVAYRGGPATMNLTASTRPLHIGAQLDPQTGWFYYSSTMIDEPAVFNRALSASEIQSIYNAGSAGKCGLPPGAPTPLINVDFGAGPASSGSPKAGPAALGHATNDFWNFYTRDDDSGGWRTFGVLSNLKFVNGAVSSSGMTVLNAPGAWGDGSSDPMYYSYIYPFDGGNVTVTVTNLAAGQYDFYVYGPDGNYQLAVGSTNYGVKTTLEASVSNPPVWQEGRQYALYRGVSVVTGQGVILTVRPGVYGYALISGMQIGAATMVTGTPPSIVAQPRSQTVAVGTNVTFTVGATGTAPLSYQWGLGGTNLAGATTSSLVLANVQRVNAGIYSVQVANGFGSIHSSNATLTVIQATPRTLINVDFGAGPAARGSTKAGPAAVGQATNDFWNFYTRDDDSGVWRTFGVLSDLKFANGAVSSGGMTVLNAPGAWGDGSSDPMYESYIYPFDGGNVTVTVTNLAAGQYDFYLYGPDGNYQLTVGPTDYGVKTTWDQVVINPPVWQAGRQYALYRGVFVAAGQGVSLTVRPGAGGYSVISGMQIASTAIAGQLPRQRVQLKVSNLSSASSGSQMQLELRGDPNRVYMVQASTTLTEWATIGLCVTDADGSVTLADPDAGKYPARLYRVMAQ